MKQALTPYRRINVPLPDATVRLVDRVAAKGDRSRLIAEAIRHYVGTAGRARLRKRLKEGAAERAERDRMLAADWFGIEAEAWPRQGR